jgi:hypothetical protein
LNFRFTEFSEVRQKVSNITHLSDALLVTRPVRCFCNEARSEAFALGKEAMAMPAVRRLKGESREEIDCSKLPEEGKTTHEIALARCNCLIDQYLPWKKNLQYSNPGVIPTRFIAGCAGRV